MTELQKELFGLIDENYKLFHQKLIPTVEADRIMGIRTPVLRKFAKNFGKRADARNFLNDLPHKYYEENNLHAFLLEQISEYDILIKELNIFLPFVDNWATCDMMRPKIFKKQNPSIDDIDRWLKSNSIYAIRFGIISLMNYYLDEDFKTEYSERVLNIKSDEYYINTARAWFFATALAKQYNNTVYILQNNLLDIPTHNQTIQKAVESYRITKEQKEYLKKLKRK